MTKATDKIIVALDVPTKKAALDLVAELGKQISFFKIGLQLFTAAGPDIVRKVLATGAKVFLDLKLYDIPNTVAHAVESAAKLGVHMLTIHLSGGEAMVKAAIAARSKEVSILGVTVLTSFDDTAIRALGIASTIEEQVSRLAKMGVAAGVDGLVVSAADIEVLRPQFGNDIELVVPGIRPAWSETGDQKRIMTPREALEAGANYLVVGRPIIAHKNPREAVKKILDEING
ncbi:MAG TPA: orotidine-5'-phosphate decarboxylase [Chthoniobacterales bacterium]|jgi:orotidine-5'-phosphate decarboxylase|nr:orotidine-5'-phosphate decarboxylase [Chthoniobacterales bacterium]